MNYESAKIAIWNQDQYMVQIDAMADAYDGPRNIALDIGAHVGTRSLWLATDGGFNRVYSVEMEPQNFALLCRNVEQNEMREKIFPIQAAISNHNGLHHITAGGCNRGQFSIAYDAADKENTRTGMVASVTLQTIMDEINSDIDFMKIDVEGAEYEIFEDPATVNAMKRVRFLFLETHGPNKDFFTDEFFILMGYDPEEPNKHLAERLIACGFKDIRKNSIGQLMMYNKNFNGSS